MNNVFRVIWNSALRCFMVVSELAKGKTKASTGTTASLLATATLLTSFSATAAPNGQLAIDNATATYDNYQIATARASEYAIWATNNADLTFTNNQATATGASAYAALVQSGSTLTLDNVALGTFATNTHTLYVADSSTVNANNLRLLPVSAGSYGINLLDNSQFNGTDVKIQSVATGILVGGSTLNIDTLGITTSGDSAYGVRYTGASDVTLANANITTGGVGGHGILGQAGNLTGSNIVLNTHGDGARGIIAQGADTQLNIDTLDITTQGASSYGIQSAATGSGGVTVNNATITTSGSAASAILAQSGETSAKNVTITTTGDGARGILANVAGAQATVDGGSISTTGIGANAVQGTSGTTLNVSNMALNVGAVGSIDYNGATGLYSGAGAVINADSLNITANSSAMWMNAGVINANNINMVQTDGNYSAVIGATNGAALNLTRADISLAAEKSQGISLDNSTATLDGVRLVGTLGGNGLTINNDGNLTAKNLDLTINNVNDAENAAILLSNGSGLNTANVADSRLVYNGAQAIGLQATTGVQNAALENTLLSTDGTAIRADTGSSLNLTVSGSNIIGQTYLLVGGQPNNAGDKVGHINITATQGSALSGDISIDNDFTDSSTLALDNSLWQGTSSGLQTLNLSNNSQWTMTESSDVGTLNLSDSTLVFNHDSDSFKTLTVNGDFTGNRGTLVMNSVLADDGSAHDALNVIGNTSGETNVVINNAGGSGAQTIQGIEVISVAGNSAGQFNQQGRIVAGAYDYNLVRGTGSNNKNWYLISDAQAVNPIVPVDPAKPVDPSEEGFPVTPVVPVDAVMATRPEAGSYLANRAAANTMFNLRLHDRGGETQYVDALTGETKTTSLWMRNVGGHNRSTDSTGQLKTQTNRYVLQIGGDLGQWSFDGNDSLHLGTMAGYGNAQSNTDSNVTGHRSKGQVDGYSLGLYGTWYQNAATQTGAYLDSWAQYGWFNNSVKGDDLPQESYKSKGVSASLEGGYRWNVGLDSAKNRYFVEPNAQFVWSNIKADDLTESNGTQVSGQGSGNVQSRVGVRASMQTHSEKQQPSFKPYIEANWINNSQNAAATLNGVSIEQRGSKNIAEMRAGVDGQLTERVNLWGNIGQQMGSENYRDSSATVGVKVSF